MSSSQPSELQVVTAKSPGTLSKSSGYVLDVMLVTFIMCMAGTIGRIPPLRRRILATFLSKFNEAKVISSYNEVALWENAMDKPFTFAKGIWQMVRLMRLSSKVAVGGIAPNVKLVDVVDGSETCLYNYQRAGRFMVLNFGSQSWGCFAANAPTMIEIESRFGAAVDFLTVYQKEAHPIGGWEAPDQPFVVKDAASTQDRLVAARDFFSKTSYPGKHAVDSIENDAVKCYGAMPDRIFVIDPTHRFVHVQDQGPPGYQPPALAKFLEQMVGKPASASL